MGYYTKIKGKIDYGKSEKWQQDVIEHIAKTFQIMGYGCSSAGYINYYNGDNEFFHRSHFFRINKKKKLIILNADIKNYEEHYQRVIAIFALYLPKDYETQGTIQGEEAEVPYTWEIKNNKLFIGDEYKLDNLDFLRMPLPFDSKTPINFLKKKVMKND